MDCIWVQHASCQLYWQHHCQKEHDLSPECCRILPRTWHGVYGEESFVCVRRCQIEPAPSVVPCRLKLSCILKSTQCYPCRWIGQRPFHTLSSHSNQCVKRDCNSFILPARKDWHFSDWSDPLPYLCFDNFIVHRHCTDKNVTQRVNFLANSCMFSW